MTLGCAGISYGECWRTWKSWAGRKSWESRGLPCGRCSRGAGGNDPGDVSKTAGIHPWAKKQAFPVALHNDGLFIRKNMLITTNRERKEKNTFFLFAWASFHKNNIQGLRAGILQIALIKHLKRQKMNNRLCIRTVFLKISQFCSYSPTNLHPRCDYTKKKRIRY